MLSETSRAEKDKDHLISFICGIFRKYKPELIGTENKLVVAVQRDRGWIREVKGSTGRLPAVQE